MIFFNAKLYGEEDLKCIQTAGPKINAIADSTQKFQRSNNEVIIDLEGATVLPGFINSHDHLDFNLFPRIGNRIYANYTEWGRDIHSHDKALIDSVLRVPQQLRTLWGMYKNLLNGFTTVVNHGENLIIGFPLLRVIQETRDLHSPAFEKNWKWKLNNPFAGSKSIVMHLGEGTDEKARTEIEQVIKSNRFKKKIIAVHGVAMSEEQAKHFKGLVWCPASNYFLLNQTAAVDQLAKNTIVVFGTDSTLSSSWNAWEHFRIAIQTGKFEEGRIIQALTKDPSTLWNLKGTGFIKENHAADFIIVNSNENLFDNEPSDILMVIQEGFPKLIDERLVPHFHNYRFEQYSTIRINNTIKKVMGNLSVLAGDIKRYFPAAEIPFIPLR
jgi:cytosine/adenosine deaminase-related metal-dependent hydrolase